MKIVFASNFMNHHQLEISKEFKDRAEYTFVATEPIPSDRLAFGYKDMNSEYDFIIRSYDSDNEYQRALEEINSADVVIFGSAPFEMIEERIKNNKLTFRYSERLFKNKAIIRKFHPIIISKVRATCTKYKDKNYYLLCASAYAANDYAWFGAFRNKSFKWGYFPKIQQIDNLDDAIQTKINNKQILWCGRFIKWKHPEYVVDCAKYLKNKNFDFKIKMIGNGPLIDKMRRLIKKNGLEEEVNIVGTLPFDKVQNEMKNSKVFLFTSDQNEGWGAVLNESMGNACCVVANKQIGSVPYLIEDEKNGYVYQTKKEFLQKVERALINQNTKDVCKNAYQTIHKYWNPEYAVKSLLDLVNKINSCNIDKIGDSKRPCERT